MIFICLIFFETLSGYINPKTVQLSKNEVNFGLQNKKLINKLLVLELFYAKLGKF